VAQQSVIAVGTPRALEVEPEDVGWVQSVTAAEEVLVGADDPVNVLVLSPEIKEPDALGLAEFVGRAAPMTAIVMVRDKSWNGLLPAAMRAGIRDVVDLTQGSEDLRDAVERAIVWAENLRSLRGAMAEKPTHRGMVISVFSSKGGTGKTFLTTNLASAIATASGQDTAVVDLDVDMGDVFSYFGLEPTRQVMDLIGLGEGADRETVFASSTKVGEHLWAFGAVPDPAMQPPAGEAIGKYLRTLGRLHGPRARVLRPVRRDLPGDGPRCRRGQAPVEGARDPAHDRSAARAVPDRPEPSGQQGRSGCRGRRARDEDPGGHDGSLEPPGPDVAQQGSSGGARGARLRGVREHPAARATVHRGIRGVPRW
jgi:DNA-binding NarL/FixJ family response regulator